MLTTTYLAMIFSKTICNNWNWAAQCYRSTINEFISTYIKL